MSLTLNQLEQRLDWVENMIANERDPKNLPGLNATYQQLLDKLVQFDLRAEDNARANRTPSH